MRAVFHTRVRIVAVVCIIAALIVASRLYFVQLVYGDEFRQQASGQYVEQDGGLYDRGDIFLTTKNGGRFAAATIRSGYSVAIHPNRIESPEELYKRASPHVSVERDRFLELAGKTDDPYETIARRVGSSTAAAIDGLDEPGIRTYHQQWRYYPGEHMAAHTIGFVGYDGNDLVGRYGLEQAYNSTLSREDTNLYVNFFAEVFANVHERLFTQERARAGDIITHIDPSVQLFLEDELSDVHEEWGSKRTAGVIIDPKTGAVAAMGSLPDFDPNTYADVDDLGRFVNPLVGHVYELGSIMKPITMAAGIDAGAVTPESTYTDRGSVTYNGETVSNYDGEARGVVDMQAVLSESLNTGAAHVAEQMGKEAFTEYMERFGMTERSGVDLPNEAKPLAGNLRNPRDIEIATASFGQGIAVTPIAMARSLSALANGGKLVTPHVVKSIDYEHGLAKDTTPDVGERAISEDTSDTVTRMLVNVVDEALAGGDVARPRYSIAAKTGTAQIPGPNGGYAEGRFLHSFFGYFPAYEPRYLVFLMTVEPQGVRYASQTLTEPFMNIVDYLISYDDIPPDR